MPPKANNTTLEEYVTLSQVRELLDQQKDFYKTLLEQQERNFKSCLQVFVDSSNKRIDDLIKQIYDFKQSLEMTQKDVDDLKVSSSALSKNCNEVRSDLDTICKSLLAYSDKTDSLEGHSRRNNVVIDGIKESGKENVAECEDKVRKLFTEKLQLDHVKIELDRVHRAGKFVPTNSDKPRPIVVRFLRLKDKMAVLDQAKRLKGTRIFINEDFPETVRQKRRELLPALKAARERGNEISQVEGLEGLHQLRELVLDRNRIKALVKNSFTAQNVLLELHLAENRIRELNHLDPLTELRKLFLGMNKLQDITELDKLEVLPSLMELSVVGNPVARNSLHRPAVVLRLSQLQVLDGVMVTLEEKTRAELLSADPSTCSQHPGASLPTPEINLHGPLHLMPHNTTLRGMSIGGGLQNVMHGHDVLPSDVDEDHYTYKYKKHKYSNVARSGQTDINFRHSRRAGSSVLSTCLLSDGNRVIITNSKQEQGSRFPNGGKPPPM